MSRSDDSIAPAASSAVEPIASPSNMRAELSLDEVEPMLAERGELGLLTVTVLQRESRHSASGWKDYENTLEAIAAFLPSST